MNPAGWRTVPTGMVEDYECEVTAPRIPVRVGRDVQSGLPTGLHLFCQAVLLFIFFVFFVAGQV